MQLHILEILQSLQKLLRLGQETQKQPVALTTYVPAYLKSRLKNLQVQAIRTKITTGFLCVEQFKKYLLIVLDSANYIMYCIP